MYVYAIAGSRVRDTVDLSNEYDLSSVYHKDAKAV